MVGPSSPPPESPPPSPAALATSLSPGPFQGFFYLRDGCLHLQRFPLLSLSLFFFLLFRATPAVYAGPQARGPTEATTAGLRPATAIRDPNQVCDPHHSSPFGPTPLLPPDSAQMARVTKAGPNHPKQNSKHHDCSVSSFSAVHVPSHHKVVSLKAEICLFCSQLYPHT